jgi:hypothetical protein
MSNEQDQKPEQQTTRSAHWRVIYTNAVGIGFGELEARFGVGFDNDMTKPGSNVTEEAVIVMPHRQAKILAFSLNAIIARWEAVNGPIPLDPNKIQEIERQIHGQLAQPQSPGPPQGTEKTEQPQVTRRR